VGPGLLLGLVALGGWLDVEDSTGGVCLDAGRLEAIVARHLGRVPFAPDAGKRARAVVRRDGQGLAARVELRTERGVMTGSREIASRGNRCADLETALTVSLVLALSHPPSEPATEAGTLTARDPTEEPDAVVPPGPVVPPPSPVAVAAVPAGSGRQASWRAWMGAGGVAGALPGFGFGPSFGGSVELLGRSLGTEARLEWGIPLQRRAFRIQSWRATGALAPCLRVGAGQVCSGLRAGLMRARGGQSSSSPTLEVIGRLLLGVPGSAVSVYAEPAVPLVRTRLSVDGARVWTAPRFSASAGLLISTR
jgi:hypothetical protein